MWFPFFTFFHLPTQHLSNFCTLMSGPSRSSDLPRGFTDDDLERLATRIVGYHSALVDAGDALSSGWEALLNRMLQDAHNTRDTQLLVAWVANLRQKFRTKCVPSHDPHVCAVLEFVRQECNKQVHANMDRYKARAGNQELPPQQQNRARSEAFKATVVGSGSPIR